MTATLLVLARFFHLGSGMVLVGVVAFRWLILLPAFAGVDDKTWRDFRPFLRQLHHLFMACGIMLIISGMALFGAVAAGMSGTSLRESLRVETWSTVLFHTQFGAVTQARLALAIFLGVLLGRLHRKLWMEKSSPSFTERTAGLMALLLLVAFAGTGHAAATSGPTLPLRIAIDALHLIAAAVWPLGLLPFALFLAYARRREAGTLRGPALRVIGRFSTVSFITVIVLASTGLLNACFLLGTIGALWATAYGELLCLKLVLFVLILGLAAWNRYQLLPLLFSATAQNKSGSLSRELQVIVLDELVLTVAIVAVVGILGITAPPG